MSLRVKRSNLVFLIFFIPFAIYLRSVYRDRIGAFGCFDDCFNITAGWFLTQGKHLYSEIFFNHQPLLAYLSAFIQETTKPDVLYLLIYQHRMAVIWFALAMGAVLILRFGFIGLAFTLLFEATKGYVFGERFLAESFIVYPIVYLVFLLFGPHTKKFARLEAVWVGVATWFVVFSREPYVPLALVLLLLLRNKITVFVFLLLSIVTIVSHNTGEYFFQVVVANSLTNAKTEILGIFGNVWSLATIVASPIIQLVSGKWNDFHIITATLSVLLLVSVRNKILLALLILALANIRPIEPGQIYYAAFHGIVWYGVLIAFTLSFSSIWQRVVIAVLIVYSFMSPSSYLHDRVDRQTEFTTNYAQYQTYGDIVRMLSHPSDTLFLDGRDDLIYWQSQRLSPYRYAWYTSFMPQIPLYRHAKVRMFQDVTPTFFYGTCQNGTLDESLLPADFPQQYVRLIASNKPTCLFVKRSKFSEITDYQWKSVTKYGVQNPSNLLQ